MSQRLPWFRMYVDFLNDPKMIALAFEDQRHFIGLLALKSDGALDMDIDDALLDRIVAQRLWIDHGVIRDVKKRLVASGLIDASWQPLAWGKRQARSDADPTGAERQRRFRDSKKQDALRNGDVTGTDKDKDTDTEAEKRQSTPDGFDDFWKTYPKKVAKPAAIRAFRSAKVNGNLPEVLAHVRYMATSEGWTKSGGQFVPNPSTYLNQRRWEDEGSAEPASIGRFV